MFNRFVWLLIVVTLLSWSGQGQTQTLPRITGTYSDMSFNKEGGDVLGEELRIVMTNKGYQGVLQFAEGEPGELMIVDLKIDGQKLSFRIPDQYADTGDFDGILKDGVLVGQFHFRSGDRKNVSLRRGKSYWD